MGVEIQCTQKSYHFAPECKQKKKKQFSSLDKSLHSIFFDGILGQKLLTLQACVTVVDKAEWGSRETLKKKRPYVLFCFLHSIRGSFVTYLINLFYWRELSPRWILINIYNRE